jgi:hypothetical protein
MMNSFRRMSGLLVGAMLGVMMGIGLSGAFSGQAAADQGAVPQRVVTLTVDLEPVKDNTLYENESGSLSNGKGDYLFAGQTGQSATRRALLAFDVAGNIPADATIISATLMLHMSKSVAVATDVTVRTLQQDWGEGASNAEDEEGSGAAAAANDATWLHTFFNTASWTQAGGDFAATATATTAVAGVGAYSWQSAALTANVQSWLSAPETNFGWILLGNESAASTAKRFDSRENPTVENRPVLTITYSAELEQSFLPSVFVGEYHYSGR